MGFHPIQGLTAAARYIGGYGTPTQVRPPEAGTIPTVLREGQDDAGQTRIEVQQKEIATPHKYVLKALDDSANLKLPFINKQLHGLGVAGAKTVVAMGAGAALSYSEILKSPSNLINWLPDAVQTPALYAPVFALITGAGLYQFGKHLGNIMYRTEGAPAHLSLQRSVAWTASFAGLWGAVRFLSDTTGVHQFMPNGSDFLFGGWMDRVASGAVDFNFDLYGAYWSTFITAAFVTNVMASLANTLPQIGYSAVAIFEKEMTGQSRIFKYLEDRPFEEKHVKLSADGQEEVIKTVSAVAAHDRVIPEVQQYKGAESERIKIGQYADDWMTKYVWRAAFAGAGIFLGSKSLDHVQQLLSNTSTDPVWSGIVGIGGGVAALGLLFSESKLAQEHLPGMKAIASFKSAMGSLFNSERLPYYGVYTLIGGVLTGGSNVFGGLLQGLDNTNGYYAKTFLRGFYSPYLNRIVLAVRLARGERNFSTFSVIFPGFLMVMGLVEAQTQSAQALAHLYDSAAAAYEISNTAGARADALEEMNYYENLVETCIENDCYGREDTLALAKETLLKIEAKKESLGLPR